MMKKRLTMIAVAIVTIGIGIAFAGFSVKADTNIESKGNIVFQDGEMGVYASDINYLQNELNILYNEIPDEDKVSPDISGFDFIRKENIQSKGIIDYAGGTVLIDSSDFIYMANEIDELEFIYKQNILKYLNGINTYFTADGSVIHDEINSDPYCPTFGELITGISLSQEVETNTTFDNLSKDKGAWVNGEYIVGNGNDVNAAYSQGYIDGVNYTVENADITYTYHEHVGEQAGAGTGCYTGSHSHTSSCIENHVCSQPIVNEVTHNVEDTGLCYGYCAKGHWTSFSHGGGCSYRTTSYGCNSLPYNTWSLTCGKTESVTIESATIVFR